MAGISLLQRLGAGFKNVAVVAIGGIVGAANSVVQTGADGFIDDSFIHPALLPAPIVLPAAAALTAGQQVNIFSNSGTESVQVADATLNLRSDGFVLANVASGASAKIYRRGGVNTALTGLTADSDYFLGAAGAVTKTQNVTANQIDQYIGKATSATVLDQLPPQIVVQN